jgi:hypothetical protein
MARTKTAVKKGKQQKSQTETRTGAPEVPKTEEQLIDELVVKIRENAEKKDKFIQVSETFKKVGPGLALTGLQRIYKQPEKSDFIYSQEFRFAGSTRVVEHLLGKLGSSVASQRLKNDIIDLTNYEQYLVVRVIVRNPVADTLISHDKMSELVKRVKEGRTAVKEDKGTPKRKKAQRRKSNTGVKVTDRITVNRLEATVSAVSDVIRKLAERQLGLDVTNVTFEESADGVVVLGGRTFRVTPQPKSKRVSVDYNGGHLSSQTSQALESFLRRIGHTDVEVSPLLTSFTDKQSTEVVKEGKQEQPEEPVVKAVVKKDKTKKAELRGSPKVTKAKTRTVKPRTSNE